MTDITSAEYVGGYAIRLEFDDGKVQIVDFQPFLTRAQHPSIRAYLDSQAFKSFRLEYGELVWGDYDLCFPVMDLYNNQILNDGGRREAA
ncbi:MAG: DUF2442 domain-containing protein [Nevskiales bacterium]|nr:DUF2442 domain-containing protein [Nevskiales bacterium]